MIRRHILGIVVLAFGAIARQAAAASPDELPKEPLFSRHIVPLFSRLGCNAGACHGAVQGKNGFRLSLFGADPGADHNRLMRELGGRRINLETPPSSLFLQKASGLVPHEGGKLIDVGGPAYQMLLNWIARGAPLDAVEQSKVKALEVEPAQHTGKIGTNYNLRVRAKFADGSTEDITALTTFDSRDRNVAEVDKSGQVKLVGDGSARLVIRYRGQPIAAQALVPREAPAEFPKVAEHNFIDKHIHAKLKHLGIHPSGLSDDATFLRRVSLDVAGELPTPDEIRAFLADKNPDKRAQKIDELLKRPGHSAVWATKFCDLYKPRLPTGNGSEGKFLMLNGHTRRFYDWIRARLQENLPYDEFIERILLASTAEGRTQDELLEEFRQMSLEDQSQTSDLKAYSRRRTLDIFWMRQGSTGVEGAIQLGHAVLGLRLQCAQCHRHPADVWQQDDLLSFANYFTGIGRPGDPRPAEEKKKIEEEAKKLADEAGKLRMQAADKKLEKDKAAELLEKANELGRKAEMIGRVSQYYSTYHIGRLAKFNFAKVSSPLGTAESKQYRLLGAAEPSKIEANEDPRQHVMAWLRRPDNPFFARAMVSRVWAHYFGRGLIDPPDDLSPLNPATHPELMQELCESFIQNRYDLRWLHRTILNSRTYQQSSEPNASNETDTVHYARFYVRRMSAELLVDAINHATASQETYPPALIVAPGSRAIEVPGPTANGPGGGQAFATMDYAFSIFGRSPRKLDSACDCDSSTASTVLQSLYLAAYGEVLKKLGDPKGRPAQLAEVADEDRRIDEAYLWTLSRLPTAEDRDLCRRHLKQAASPQKGMEDLLWVLLNTREFLLIR